MSPPSPYDDPVPRGWKFVQGALRVAVSVQCAGAAIAEWQQADESPVLALLRSAYEIPSEWTLQFGTFASYALGIAALLTLMRPLWPLLVLVTLWFGACAAARFVETEQAPAAGALIIHVVLPLVLLLVDFWPPPLSFSIGRATVSLALLRMGIILSLGFHAALVWCELAEPGRWSQLMDQAVRVMEIPSGVAETRQLLAAILAVDAALAVNLLLSRSRPAAMLTAAWSVALAALPLIARGPDEAADSLLLASAGGAPLALGLYWMMSVKEQPAIIVPGNA
jgi:hypothetical protein